jgi:hypothetical protein
MSVTDLRLLDPSRKDLIAALQAAAKTANFRRRTGRLTLAAADREGLVSRNCSVPGGGGRRWRPGSRRWPRTTGRPCRPPRPAPPHVGGQQRLRVRPRQPGARLRLLATVG